MREICKLNSRWLFCEGDLKVARPLTKVRFIRRAKPNENFKALRHITITIFPKAGEVIGKLPASAGSWSIYPTILL